MGCACSKHIVAKREQTGDDHDLEVAGTSHLVLTPPLHLHVIPSSPESLATLSHSLRSPSCISDPNTVSVTSTEAPNHSFGCDSIGSGGGSGDLMNYDCVRRIGSGEYGTVYLVVQKETGKLCAAKEIKHNWTSKDDEIRMLKSCLGHPCIVQFEEVIHARFSSDKVDISNKVPTCIVTEYIDGIPWGTSNFSQRRGPIPFTLESIRTVRGILRDVLLALHHMHEVVGIAHMDIKPENIMVLNNESSHKDELHHGLYAKVIDLGSAIECTSKTSNTAGTYYYCSPEKLATYPGTKYCPKKADIWALGVTAAVAIYGDPNVPFVSVTTRALFWAQICHSSTTCVTLPTVTSHGTIVPTQLVNLLELMLLRNPNERPTASQLLSHSIF